MPSNRTKLGGKKSASSSAGGKKKKGSGKKKKGSAKPKSAKSTKSEPAEVDMMSAPAMENLYYIAHSCPDALNLRGFGWEGAAKGGKKGKKKKK